MTLFYRGLTKGKLGDRNGAIADYTRAIELPHAPVGFVTLALFNRGLSKGKSGDTAGAITDLTPVIQLPYAMVELVAMAHSPSTFWQP